MLAGHLDANGEPQAFIKSNATFEGLEVFDVNLQSQIGKKATVGI